MIGLSGHLEWVRATRNSADFHPLVYAEVEKFADWIVGVAHYLRYPLGVNDYSDLFKPELGDIEQIYYLLDLLVKVLEKASTVTHKDEDKDDVCLILSCISLLFDGEDINDEQSESARPDRID